METELGHRRLGDTGEANEQQRCGSKCRHVADPALAESKCLHKPVADSNRLIRLLTGDC